MSKIFLIYKEISGNNVLQCVAGKILILVCAQL